MEETRFGTGERDEQIRRGWSYDVFLSFCGKDTRESFTDHLFSALRNSGIHTFRDNEELRKGEAIGTKLMESIRESKILVVVFSKNYASSSWCLDELLHITECCRSNPGKQAAYPIFHGVDPSDLRWQKGAVGESFSRHESRYPSGKTRRWRAALHEAANLSGWDLRGRHEAECIKDITKEILKKLDNSYLHVASYPVGVRTRVRRIYPLMSIGSDDVRVIGIYGMGGIGKTTIAKAAYNEFSHHFEGKSFLANFRERSKKIEGKIHLQRKLLYDILKRRDIEFDGFDQAVKERFRGKRVLVVIDDAEDANQLNSIAIDLSWFGPGSRILITTRDEHLLRQLGVNRVYLPETLNRSESLQLFSWHAFRTNEPPQEFLRLSENVTEYCGGLPLAVEILGAFLFDRSAREWESALELLKRVPDDRIQRKLRISFDALSSVHKEVFLDIACFFTGMDKDYVIRVLDGCGLSPGIALTVLSERCLVTVYDDKLSMHDLIRDMGREIVREQAPKNRGKRSRLWDPDDVIDVLTKHSGTEAVEGLSLEPRDPEAEFLDAEAFSKLRELRLLRLGNVKLRGSYSHLPKGLRWLSWCGFSSEFLPREFCLRALVVMDMRYSNIRRLWDAREVQPLEKLKFLDLSYSIYLRETPDFTYLPNLEKLLLIECKSLVLVHNSIGILGEKLAVMDLNGCSELERLPIEFYRLKSLETLVLSGCSKLKNLDDAFGELESLTTLLADYTAMTETPSSIVRLKKLQKLSLCGCGKRSSHGDYVDSEETPREARLLPVSLKGFTCLRTLRLSFCNLRDELIPEDLGSLSCLEELDLRGNMFRDPRTDFAALSKLRILRLDNCSKLKSVTSLPSSLRSFFATNCTLLERTPDLSECSHLQALHLTNCLNLVETPGLDKLTTVRVIRMEMCSRVAETFKEKLLQGWTVSGYGGIFIPGSKLPSWFSFKDGKNSVSFTVPESISHNLAGLTLCARYTSKLDHVMSGYSPHITVRNRARNSVVWTRRPATLHVLMYRADHLWQGHISNESLRLEAGDRVEVEVNFGDQVTVLETGVALVYEARDDYTESLCRAAIEHASGLNKPGVVAIDDEEMIRDVYVVDKSVTRHDIPSLLHRHFKIRWLPIPRTFMRTLGLLTFFFAMGIYSGK